MKISPAGQSARELRQTFDAGFAQLPPTQGAAEAALLAITCAGEACAIRLQELDGLALLGTLVAVPGAVETLLGITGFRGAVVPVFSLARLLGFAAEKKAPRWLALCGGTQPVGLAFSQFEFYFTAKLSEIGAAQAAAEAGAHSGAGPRREIVRHADVVRPVLSIPELLSSIAERASSGSGLLQMPGRV